MDCGKSSGERKKKWNCTSRMKRKQISSKQKADGRAKSSTMVPDVVLACKSASEIK